MAEPAPVLVGTGGHARVVAEAMLPRLPAGHLAERRDTTAPASLGPLLGDDSHIARLAVAGHPFVVGVGFVDRDGSIRRSELLARLERRRQLLAAEGLFAAARKRPRTGVAVRQPPGCGPC